MRDLQRDIGAAIREGRVPEELVARLKPGGRLTLRAALGVYSGGYVARLTEALGETFEAVWWVLGDREFFALAKAFIAGNDSRTYNLSSYGEAFPAYLRHAGPPSAPFLHDLARFEWLFRESFNEPPPAPFDHAELHLLHERSDVVLKFQKNVRLFSAPYSVYPIWRSRGDDPEKTGPIAWDQPEHLFIFKRDQAMFVETLDPSSHHLFELMAGGLPLDQAVDRTQMLFGDLTEERISQFFGDLIKAGVIAGIEAAGQGS